MGRKNVRAKQIDERIRQIGYRTCRILAGKQDGLSSYELLPLRASRAVNPPGKAREAIHCSDGRLTGSGRWRWRWRRTDLQQGDDSMRSGADAGVSDLSKRTGLEELQERLGPVRGRSVMTTSPPVHGVGIDGEEWGNGGFRQLREREKKKWVGERWIETRVKKREGRSGRGGKIWRESAEGFQKTKSGARDQYSIVK